MLKAFHSFNPSTGFKFVTYASRAMANEILMQFRKAEYKKVTSSIYEPVSGDANNDMTLLDVLEDPSVAFENIVEQKALVELVLKEATSLLNEREYIIISNVLADEPKNQKQLAEYFGVSQSYVSRIEGKTLKKIRDFFENVTSTKRSNKKDLHEKEKGKMNQPTSMYVEGKTLFEKVKYALEHYPNMSVEEIANGMNEKVATVRTYVSQIKNENSNATKQEPPKKSNLDEDDLKVLSEIKKIEEENERLKAIAKDAIDKMLLCSKEKEEMSKQLGNSNARIEQLSQLNNLLMSEILEVRSAAK